MSFVYAYPETLCRNCLRTLSSAPVSSPVSGEHEKCDPTALQAAAAARGFKTSELVYRVSHVQLLGARTTYQRYLDDACGVELDYRVPRPT